MILQCIKPTVKYGGGNIQFLSFDIGLLKNCTVKVVHSICATLDQLALKTQGWLVLTCKHK